MRGKQWEIFESNVSNLLFGLTLTDVFILAFLFDLPTNLCQAFALFPSGCLSLFHFFQIHSSKAKGIIEQECVQQNNEIKIEKTCKVLEEKKHRQDRQEQKQ